MEDINRYMGSKAIYMATDIMQDNVLFCSVSDCLPETCLFVRILVVGALLCPALTADYWPVSVHVMLL